jgi:glycosyltransferase involved in cell wall biosynthesis
MRIALLGTRGIPASYGGFETFAEELSTRLVERGHSVRVYCRRHATAGLSRFRGVDLAYSPTIRHKYFDTVVHTFFSSIDLMFRRADVALYCNGANAVFTLLPRITGIPVALNVDGIERKRKKWNAAARAWYLISEWLATWCPNEVITDARHIADYYLERYRAQTRFIPYGAATEKTPQTDALSGLGLEPDRYFLYVSRMEPENNALLVREAFERVNTDRKLALIGDAPYAEEYIARVRDTRDGRIVMPGAIYGEGYRQLGSHCFAYIHATEVGGTHPALIEAMGRGALTLFLDTAENREVAGGAAIPFTHDTLADRIQEVLAMSEEERRLWRERARNRVTERYSWDAVTTMYEDLLAGLCSRPRQR